MRFKKGELTKESLNIIIFDIDNLLSDFLVSFNEKSSIQNIKLIKQFINNHRRLKGNLKDIWRIKC